MSAEKVIHTLLAGAAAVTAVVGAGNIWPGELPQGTVLPALGISHLVTPAELTTMDAQAAYRLVQTRIEVTLLARNDANGYVVLKDLLDKVRKACNYAHGTIGGISVGSVLVDTIGPDQRDSDLGVLSQTIDFLVTWQQANT